MSTEEKRYIHICEVCGKTEVLTPMEAYEAYANGAAKDLDFIQGCNKDEVNYYVYGFTVDVLPTLLGNSEALQMYGSVVNANLSEMLQALLLKFVSGAPLQLYRNEITGFDGLNWKAFPQALIVANGKLLCNTIDDRITEVKGLSDYTVK